MTKTLTVIFATLSLSQAFGIKSVTSSITSVVDDVGQTIDDVEQTAIEVGDTVKDGVEQGVNTVEDGVETVIRTVEDWFKEFDDWMEEFGQQFDEAEKAFRMEIYKTTVTTVESANKAFEEAGDSLRLEVNGFAASELSEIPTGRVLSTERDEEVDPRRIDTTNPSSTASSDIPPNFSWRNHMDGEAVRWVKYQHCDNCWAHAAAAALETRNYITNCHQMDLSVNMIANCAFERTYQNYIADEGRGCEGDQETWAWELASVDGFATTPSFMSPYVGMGATMDVLFGDNHDDKVCDISAGDVPFKYPGPGAMVPPGKQNGGWKVLQDYTHYTTFEALKEELYKNGACTAAIGIDDELKQYKTGLWTPKVTLNHAVTVVGYGTDELGRNYLECKNSWGDHTNSHKWGDDGYFKMYLPESVLGPYQQILSIHCPNIVDTGVCRTCADGEVVSANDGTSMTPVVKNVDEKMRTYSSIYKGAPSGDYIYGSSKLDSGYSWRAATNKASASGHWIQIDLGAEYSIAGIKTQGRPFSNEYVTYYTVHYGSSIYNLRPFKNKWGINYYNANMDDSTTHTHTFEHQIDGSEYNGQAAFKARYIRITATEWNMWPSMRVAVLVFEENHDSCFCAGHVCPLGTMCSFARGCVAPEEVAPVVGGVLDSSEEESSGFSSDSPSGPARGGSLQCIPDGMQLHVSSPEEAATQWCCTPGISVQCYANPQGDGTNPGTCLCAPSNGVPNNGPSNYGMAPPNDDDNDDDEMLIIVLGMTSVWLVLCMIIVVLAACCLAMGMEPKPKTDEGEGSTPGETELQIQVVKSDEHKTPPRSPRTPELSLHISGSFVSDNLALPGHQKKDSRLECKTWQQPDLDGVEVEMSRTAATMSRTRGSEIDVEMTKAVASEIEMSNAGGSETVM